MRKPQLIESVEYKVESARNELAAIAMLVTLALIGLAVVIVL